jgi:hypothetical protein
MEKREPKGTKTVSSGVTSSTSGIHANDPGTPTFIALEVAGADPIERAPEIIGLFGYMESIRKTMPVGHPDADFLLDFQQKAGTYHTKYNESNLVKAHTQRWQTSVALHEPRAVVHEPRHDVESMFWLLCFALARANPKSAATNPCDPTTEYSDFCDSILNHLDGATLRKHRGYYLGCTEEKWKKILHPSLVTLSRMLHHMGRYLAIRSFDKDTEWDLYHAHRVFKILLFPAIRAFQSGDPIPLCQHAPRYAGLIPGTRTGGNTPTITGLRNTPPSGGSSHSRPKRGSSQAGLDADDQKPGKRVKVAQPARLEQEE